jgi:hypothetical protein
MGFQEGWWFAGGDGAPHVHAVLLGVRGSGGVDNSRVVGENSDFTFGGGIMRSGGIGMVVGLVVAVAGVVVAGEPDLSTPQGARRAYVVAEHEGDAAGMKAAAIYDGAWEKVIEAGAAAEKEMGKLRKAAGDRWGAAGKSVFPEMRTDEIEGTAYRVNGDRAELTYHGTVVERYRKVEGKWKKDLVTPVMEGFPDDPRGMVRSAAAYGRAAGIVAGRVEAGEFATAKEAHKAFDDLRAVLFEPSSAATRPGVGATTRRAPTTRPARGR